MEGLLDPADLPKMRVRCEHCECTWVAQPLEYPRGRTVAYCPRCGRGYFLQEDGSWMSDHPLTILEEEV